MKKGIVVLSLVLVIIAILTNPNQNRHKEVLEDKIKTYMQKAMGNQDDDGLDSLFGNLLGNVIVSTLIDNFVSTDNYILFSTTKLTWQGETKIIGIGAFGNVFITKRLSDAMNDGLLEN